MHINTTFKSFDCSTFDTLRTQNDIRGSYYCSTDESAASTSSNSSTPSSNNTTHAESGLSAGAKAGIAIGTVFAVIIIITSTFFILRRRKRSARIETQDPLGFEDDKKASIKDATEMPGDNQHPIQEMLVDERPHEMQTGGVWETSELSA